MRPRVSVSVPIRVEFGGISGNCTAVYDSEFSGSSTSPLSVMFRFSRAETSGTTVTGTALVGALEGGDLQLTGGLVCSLAEVADGFVLPLLRSTLEDAVEEALLGLVRDQPCGSP
jgi:hypothetical protein